MTVTPVPVEELKIGDIIYRNDWHWRITAIESWTAQSMVGTKWPHRETTAYRLVVEKVGFGSDVKRLAPYYEGELIAFVREATVAETAARAARTTGSARIP